VVVHTSYIKKKIYSRVCYIYIYVHQSRTKTQYKNLMLLFFSYFHYDAYTTVVYRGSYLDSHREGILDNVWETSQRPRSALIPFPDVHRSPVVVGRYVTSGGYGQPSVDMVVGRVEHFGVHSAVEAARVPHGGRRVMIVVYGGG